MDQSTSSESESDASGPGSKPGRLRARRAGSRTDVHRPGAIVPAHYDCWQYCSLPTTEGGYPLPRIGVDCADPVAQFDASGRVAGYLTPVCPDTGRCCVASAHRGAARDGRAVFGGLGKCGVCGACFRRGSVFRHEPTGELVHMGHDCADKYQLMYDLSAFEIEQGRLRAAHGTAIARAQNEDRRRKFLDGHPGIEAALALGRVSTADRVASKQEAILADMAGRFSQYCSLSDKIAFAIRLAGEIASPAPAEVAERHCTAPIGKGVSFEGEIVSCKLADGYMGGSAYKMTVKVTTADGATWLAHGTCPTSLTECLRATDRYGGGRAGDLRGRHVVVRATLELPRERRSGEDHFVFMSRPVASFVDLFDYPRYQVPKCTIGEPCRIIQRRFDGCSGEWSPMICDGSCKNAAKVPRSRRGAKNGEASS